MRSRGSEARVKNQGDELGDYYYHPQGDLNHKVVNIKKEKTPFKGVSEMGAGPNSLDNQL